MRYKRLGNGFSLAEIMVTTTIFALVMLAIFHGMERTQKTVKSEAAMNSAQSGATMLVDRLGRDIRESSYAYVFAGDWYAARNVAGTTIHVARNYFSSNPLYGGTTLVPGISNEGWAQCPNPVCNWCNRQEGAGMAPNFPMAFLARPVRNNYQTITPFYPPPSFQFSSWDARGRILCNAMPGETCPECGSLLSSDAYFGGLLMFSPRRQDNSFSYVDEGDEARWESMVFYCPFRRAQGQCEIRRYVFYASSINVNAGLADLLDFDGDGLIESPPMTDTFGDFVLDADGECFSLTPSGGVNRLLYTRWDGSAGRSFRIEVDRTSGVAEVTVVGGPYGGAGTVKVQLRMERYATGLSDFDASTFLNNPSWETMGSVVNPSGVAELGAVRVTFQVDRMEQPRPNYMESVQTIMFRPRN